jgi:hypothetical protein
MKKTLLLVAFVIASLSASAQQVDSRLSNYFSAAEIEQFAQKDNYLNVLSYALDNGLYVIDVPKGKELGELKSIKFDEKKPVNFLDLGLQIETDTQVFKIEGTERLLLLKSEWMLNYELSKAK